jgi:uncharacterized protein (TIGR03437 family)
METWRRPSPSISVMRLLPFLLAFAVTPAFTQQNLLNTLNLMLVAEGFNQPTAIANAGDGSDRLFVTERAGRIWVLGPNRQRLATPFLDIRNKVGSNEGEQGLLGLAFHPEHASNGRFFVNYTDRSGDTVISEFTVSADRNRADAGSERVFFTVDQPFGNHNGGQLQFGPDGMLYAGMGDGGSGGDPGNRAQTLSSPLGKLLRFDVNQGPPARAPQDNPFVGTPGAEPTVWAYGLRNPWRFSFDRATGDMWIADVGQNLWEEVSFAPAASHRGRNYGWRFMEGRHCFNPATNCNDGTLTLPVMEYSHSDGACSVTGGYRYRGARHPGLDGVYFFADLCRQRLEAGVETSPGVFQRLSPRVVGGSISTFGEDEAGEIYYAAYDGRIFRIDAPPQAPRVSQNGVVNGASFAAGQAVTPGSIVSVFGSALAGGSASAAGAPLPVELAGARFVFTPGGAALLPEGPPGQAGVPAPLFFASPGQVNLQLPWELAGSSAAQLTVVVNGLQSVPFSVPLAQVRPGVFTMDQSGSGQAAALIAGAGALAAPLGVFPNARPARLGEHLEVFATGLGPVTNRPATGASPSDQLAETELDVTARVGGVEPVAVRFSGLAPGFVGLYQVNIQLVGDLPSGPAVPLTLSAGGVESNTVTIAIE